MSARRSPIERAARLIAGDALNGAWRRRTPGQTAWQVLEDAVLVCERATARAVVADDIPRARRAARAGQLLDEAQTRLVARQGRDKVRKLAQVGIVGNARVVVVGAGYGALAPVGTVMTLEAVTDSYYLQGTDDDGRRWMVYYRDIEVVPDAPSEDQVESGQYMTVEEIESAASGGAFDDGEGQVGDPWDATPAEQSQYGLDLADAVIAARREGLL